MTASERVTIENPFFLWVFTHQLTQEVTAVFLTKQNSTSTRYDLFIIEMPDDIDLENGEYQYRIYQKATDESTEVELDDVLLEIGFARVPQETPIDNFYHITEINGSQHN